VGTLASAAPAPSPPEESLPELAAQLEDHLRGRAVVAPDGAVVPVVSSMAEDLSDALLDAARIEACLRTVGAAEAWPSAWLVVQVRALPYDLVLPVRLDERGRIEDPEPVFAAERREWNVDALREAIRSRTGRKPKGRTWNLVVQGFTTRVVERYVYEAPTERRGLLELLPEGTLLREATTVVLDDGSRHTLALVLQDAELVPSTCDDCNAWMIGHADTGRILLVLTGADAIEDELDLTPVLHGVDGAPLLARYRCEEGDRDPEFRRTPIGERFAGREPRVLIRLEDLDGDGRALEIRLTSSVEGCEAKTVRLGVDPAGGGLRLVADP
jgi:hypothetical protein